MKLTIEPTDKIVHVNGVEARVWEGQTESGAKVHLFITRIGVDASDSATCDQFARELRESSAPTDDRVRAYPARLVL